MRQRLAEQEFKQLLKDKTNNIEILLREQLPQNNPSLQKTIFDAMEYSVMAGGKRLRPLLMQETYLLFGGQERSVISSLISLSDLPFIASAIFCSSLFVADNEKLRSGAIKENVPNPINITASVKIKINFLYRSGIYPHPSSNIKTHLEGLEPPAHGSGNRCSIH